MPRSRPKPRFVLLVEEDPGLDNDGGDSDGAEGETTELGDGLEGEVDGDTGFEVSIVGVAGIDDVRFGDGRLCVEVETAADVALGKALVTSEEADEPPVTGDRWEHPK
ncbi:MAG: hypothetical protein Q9207_006737 [Kuettlingeria erythrocarpa]